MARRYSVVGQRQIRAEGPDGRMVDAVEVSYVGPGNVVGSVTIPVSAFTPDNVAAQIEQRIGTHDAIRALGE